MSGAGADEIARDGRTHALGASGVFTCACCKEVTLQYVRVTLFTQSLARGSPLLSLDWADAAGTGYGAGGRWRARRNTHSKQAHKVQSVVARAEPLHFSDSHCNMDLPCNLVLHSMSSSASAIIAQLDSVAIL